MLTRFNTCKLSNHITNVEPHHNIQIQINWFIAYKFIYDLRWENYLCDCNVNFRKFALQTIFTANKEDHVSKKILASCYLEDYKSPYVISFSVFYTLAITTSAMKASDPLTLKNASGTATANRLQLSFQPEFPIN